MKRPPSYGVPSGPEIIARHKCICDSCTRHHTVDDIVTGSPPPIMSAAC